MDVQTVLPLFIGVTRVVSPTLMEPYPGHSVLDALLMMHVDQTSCPIKYLQDFIYIASVHAVSTFNWWLQTDIVFLYATLKGNNAFPWISARIYDFNIGAPIECAHSILHVTGHTKGHTSNSWNKCPKRGLMTTDGQSPIEKHYRSLHGRL